MSDKRKCRQCPEDAELIVRQGSVGGGEEYFCVRCYNNLCNGFSGCCFPGMTKPPAIKISDLATNGGQIPDKAPKDCTMVERRAMYSKVRCAPATDHEARQLERVLWLFREMPRIKPKYVLDIGCESGLIDRWMVDEPYVQKLIGIDPCEFSIAHAKNLIKRRRNPNKATYIIEGWEGISTRDLYNAIVCFECIEHFMPNEGIELIKRAHSLLAPGGTAFLCTPSAEGRYGKNNPDPWHLTIYDRDGLSKLIKDTIGVVPVSENTDHDFIMIKWTKS